MKINGKIIYMLSRTMMKSSSEAVKIDCLPSAKFEMFLRKGFKDLCFAAMSHVSSMKIRYQPAGAEEIAGGSAD